MPKFALCKFESISGGVSTSQLSKMEKNDESKKLCVCAKNPSEIKGYCKDCFDKLKEKYNRLFTKYQDMAISQNIIVPNIEYVLSEKYNLKLL